MSDLRVTMSDQSAAKRACESARLSGGPDRNPALRDHPAAWLGLVLIAACAPAPVIPVKLEPAAAPVAAIAIERWVDGSASEGGDGSRAHPFKRLGPALQPDTTVHLK